MKEFKLFSPIIRLNTVSSTNDYAISLLKKDKPAEGTVILAEFQEKGKGQKDSKWISENGKNLTFSIIIYPVFLAAEIQFYLSMSISLGIIDFLSSITESSVIKWPNDIFIGRKKIAGVLIENSLSGNKINNSVIGIGFNVNQVEFPEIQPEPTSLALECKKEFNRDEITLQLLNSVEKYLNLLYSGQYSEVKLEYENNLLFFGKSSLYADEKGEFKGIIKGVNELGQLLVKKPDGILYSYNFKEIKYML